MINHRRFVANAHGVVAIELAFVIPLLFFAFIAFFEFARILWIRSTMEYALVAAARFATMNAMAPGLIEGEFNSRIYHFDARDFTFSTGYTEDQGIHYEQLQTTYPSGFLFGFMTGFAHVKLQTRTFVPTPAGMYACPVDKQTLAGARGYIRRIVNLSNNPVDLYTYDNKDKTETYVAHLDVQDARLMVEANDQAGHPWIIKDMQHNCLMTIVPWRPEATVFISGIPPAR